jgi:hypothetical protein
MALPKWAVIAKSKYYTFTGSFRTIRPIFPFLVLAALAVFVGYVAPKIVALLVDEVIAFFLSQVAIIVVQVMLFTFFFMFLSLPIAYTLKDINIEQQWIFLKAPLKTSDILLGEFLGEMPLYIVLITIIAGFFTTLLNPLGIDAAQKTIIVLVFIITLISALWIGTIIAALLRTRLGKSARGRDMGKAFSVVIILPFVAFMYAFMSGSVFRFLADPGTSGIVRGVLAFFPSSWGADIINELALNPGDMGAVGLDVITHLGGLIAFFVVIVFLGTKVADRAYNLEVATFTAVKAQPDGAFYSIINHIGGGRSFGTLLVSTFKVYTRRFHNLSWLTYAVCLAAILGMFSPPSLRPDNPQGVIVMSSIVFSILAAVVVSDATIRGKETLLMYKKVPSGVGILIKTRLIQSWLIVIPIGVIIVAVAVMLIPQMPIAFRLAHIGLAVLMSASYVVFALGLFLVNPVYSENEGPFVLNMLAIVWSSLFLCFVCLHEFGDIRGVLLIILSSLVLGITFSYLGKRHLSRME